MLIGGVAIALMQAAVKLLSYNLHPFIITLYRAALVFIVLLPILFWRGFETVKTSSIKVQMAREAVGGIGLLCVFTGLSLVPLAEATALLFTVPIFATILAVGFLSEKVSIRRWSAILSITFWQAMGCVPLAFAASLFVWKLPTLEQLMYLLGIACLGTLGHALLYASLKVGKVSVILPLDYIRIIWSALLGFLLFNHLPTSQMYLGSLLIICATAFISYRELKKT